MTKFLIVLQWNYATGESSNAGTKAVALVVLAPDAATAKTGAEKVLSKQLASASRPPTVQSVIELEAMPVYLAMKQDDNVEVSIVYPMS